MFGNKCFLENGTLCFILCFHSQCTHSGKVEYTFSMQPKHSVMKNTIANDIFQSKIYNKWLGTVAFPADVDAQVSINPNDLLHIASFVGHLI